MEQWNNGAMEQWNKRIMENGKMEKCNIVMM